MNFYTRLNLALQKPLISPKKPRLREKKEITALPIRANNITLISTNTRFTSDYCKVHSLADYRREYFKSALVPIQISGLDFLLFDPEEIGSTIAEN